MKPLDILQVTTESQQVSDEIRKVQFMAQVRDEAEHHARHMAAYAAWSNPVAIAERKAEHEKAAPAAKEKGELMAQQAIGQMMLARQQKETGERHSPFKIKLVQPKKTKQNWWATFKQWIKTIF